MEPREAEQLHRDALVIDSVGFNDLTWLDRGGYFTSDKKRVIKQALDLLRKVVEVLVVMMSSLNGPKRDC